jgi:hypothetical protein
MVRYTNPVRPECEAELCEAKRIEGSGFALTTSGLSVKKLSIFRIGSKYEIVHRILCILPPQWYIENQVSIP